MRETIQDLEDRLSKLEGILAEELWKSEEPIRQKERKRTADTSKSRRKVLARVYTTPEYRNGICKRRVNEL